MTSPIEMVLLLAVSFSRLQILILVQCYRPLLFVSAICRIITFKVEVFCLFVCLLRLWGKYLFLKQIESCTVYLLPSYNYTSRESSLYCHAVQFVGLIWEIVSVTWNCANFQLALCVATDVTLKIITARGGGKKVITADFLIYPERSIRVSNPGHDYSHWKGKFSLGFYN